MSTIYDDDPGDGPDEPWWLFLGLGVPIVGLIVYVIVRTFGS